VPESVIEAIRQGIWDFEPEETNDRDYSCTAALPGSVEKLDVLADRLKKGEPLWHPSDRITFRDNDDD
jgi:hypothetical protein